MLFPKQLPKYFFKILYLLPLQRALASKLLKSHTVFEMGSHDLSPHTFRSGLQFWKGPQKGVLKNWIYFLLGSWVLI